MHSISKVTTHISHNEQLIFERSQPGRAGFSLPPFDVDEIPLDEIVPREFQREDILAGMPEVTEVDVVRHFTRMSSWNYSIDQGMYPLGSCTMKYNSRLNEKVARIAGFANLHPLAAEAESQGALQVICELQQHLLEITGLPGISLQPAAGAHGEMTGILIIRAFIDARDGKEGSAKRRIMLIPDSAHGTNPASAHLSGFTVQTIRSTNEGLTDLEHLRELCAHGDVAGLMLTNPNTLAFFGNYVMMLRALAYILTHGYDGLREATEAAVLNARYITHGLTSDYEKPFAAPPMHEVVFTDKRQARKSVHTLDIAKRLIDYGFHPPTIYFPLIVSGAMLIEPTESVGRQELDQFIEAMRSIAREAVDNPELVLNAPHTTRIGRLDEAAAARKPVLRWKPAAPPRMATSDR